MYSTFQQTSIFILYTKLKGLWQLKFVNKFHTKVCQNVGCFYLYSPCFWFSYFLLLSISVLAFKKMVLKFLYKICNRPVAKNHQRIQCDTCDTWVHHEYIIK